MISLRLYIGYLKENNRLDEAAVVLIDYADVRNIFICIVYTACHTVDVGLCSRITRARSNVSLKEDIGMKL